jgi:HlyD family secretion protein
MRANLLTALSILGLVAISCGSNNKLPQGSGLVEATEVTLSAETGGQLKTLYFNEGDDIAPGDTVALIDTSTVRLRLRQAQAAGEAAQTKREVSRIGKRQAAVALTLAKKEFDRIATLVKTGSASQQQYDQAESGLEQAQLGREQADAAVNAAEADLNNTEAQIALLEKQVADCFPISPISGVVVEKFLEPGELVGIGKALVRIAKLDTVWVNIYVPPSDLTRISLGSAASVDAEDGRAAPLEGRVTWISSEAEFTPKNVQTKEARAGLLYAVKVTIPNPDRILKIGMPVAVTVAAK